MIRKEQNTKKLVALAACVLNRQYMVTHCTYGTSQSMMHTFTTLLGSEATNTDHSYFTS